jgi:hypothetical protein
MRRVTRDRSRQPDQAPGGGGRCEPAGISSASAEAGIRCDEGSATGGCAFVHNPGRFSVLPYWRGQALAVPLVPAPTDLSSQSNCALFLKSCLPIRLSAVSASRNRPLRAATNVQDRHVVRL